MQGSEDRTGIYIYAKTSSRDNGVNEPAVFAKSHFQRSLLLETRGAHFIDWGQLGDSK
jgi:hypothetical protein